MHLGSECIISGGVAFQAVFGSCVEPLPLLEGLALVLSALRSLSCSEFGEFCFSA